MVGKGGRGITEGWLEGSCEGGVLSAREGVCYIHSQQARPKKQS